MCVDCGDAPRCGAERTLPDVTRRAIATGGLCATLVAEPSGEATAGDPDRAPPTGIGEEVPEESREEELRLICDPVSRIAATAGGTIGPTGCFAGVLLPGGGTMRSSLRLLASGAVPG